MHLHCMHAESTASNNRRRLIHDSHRRYICDTTIFHHWRLPSPLPSATAATNLVIGSHRPHHGLLRLPRHPLRLPSTSTAASSSRPSTLTVGIPPVGCDNIVTFIDVDLDDGTEDGCSNTTTATTSPTPNFLHRLQHPHLPRLPHRRQSTSAASPSTTTSFIRDAFTLRHLPHQRRGSAVGRTAPRCLLHRQHHDCNGGDRRRGRGWRRGSMRSCEGTKLRC